MTRVVIGLGNPGPQYAATRHNAGHMVLDELATRGAATLSVSRRLHCRTASVRIGDEPVVLAAPMSYMNVSGGPAAAVAKYYRTSVTELIVIHDELDIPFGQIRLKAGGGTGGHNGLKSIGAALGPGFLRIRVGIGRPAGGRDAADFVLAPFSSQERVELPLLVDRAADAVGALIEDGLQAAQQQFHAP